MHERERENLYNQRVATRRKAADDNTRKHFFMEGIFMLVEGEMRRQKKILWSSADVNRIGSCDCPPFFSHALDFF